MATIITVHGTFAGGEETGSQWWQRGSAFETTMRDLIEAEDGKLEFTPHRWDGLNSEMSRQTAGAALAGRIGEFEKRNESYCIVAHSHGGSVALSALTQCVYLRRPIPGLSRWITIGAPFIQFARKRLLFSRLGLFGKAAWLSLFTFFSLLCVSVALDKYKKGSTVEAAQATFAVAMMFLVIHAIIGWFQDRRRALHGRSIVGSTHKWWSAAQYGLFGRLYLVSILIFYVFQALNGAKNGNYDVLLFAALLFIASTQLPRFLNFLMRQVVRFWRWRAVNGRRVARSRHKWWTVARYGLLGRLYFVVLLIAFVVVASASVRTGNQREIPSIMLMYVSLALLAPFFIFLVAQVVRFLRWIGFAGPSRAPIADTIVSRWHSFRHPQDEAVEGLAHVATISFPIFDRDFAVRSLTFFGVLLLPAVALAVVVTPALARAFANIFLSFGVELNGIIANGRLIGEGSDVGVNVGVLIGLPIGAIIGKNPNPNTLAFGIFILAPLIFLGGAVVMVATTRLVAAAISRLLSIILNRAVWSQIRASAHGNDTLGEVSLTAAEAPEGLAAQAALPAVLAQEISAVADRAAASAVSKFRSSLNRLAFAGDTRSERDLVSEYLTWDELVHTAYFKVELFNKYVAYVIANSEGFKPSARFIADPDYLRLAAWYADYNVREQTAATAPMARIAAK